MNVRLAFGTRYFEKNSSLRYCELLFVRLTPLVDHILDENEPVLNSNCKFFSSYGHLIGVGLKSLVINNFS